MNDELPRQIRMDREGMEAEFQLTGSETVKHYYFASFYHLNSLKHAEQ